MTPMDNDRISKGERSENALDHSISMRSRSGNINGSGRLIAFLYELIRDHVTPGVIEKLMIGLEGGSDTTYEYSNGWLATYCMDVAARLHDQ